MMPLVERIARELARVQEIGHWDNTEPEEVDEVVEHWWRSHLPRAQKILDDHRAEGKKLLEEAINKLNTEDINKLSIDDWD